MNYSSIEHVFWEWSFSPVQFLDWSNFWFPNPNFLIHTACLFERVKHGGLSCPTLKNELISPWVHDFSLSTFLPPLIMHWWYLKCEIEKPWSIARVRFAQSSKGALHIKALILCWILTQHAERFGVWSSCESTSIVALKLGMNLASHLLRIVGLFNIWQQVPGCQICHLMSLV